ncbi:MAG: S8 family peptidase [Bacteroidia bacterium]|nr:S8 family peptidase [Bacteroidia bacterium]
MKKLQALLLTGALIISIPFYSFTKNPANSAGNSQVEIIRPDSYKGAKVKPGVLMIKVKPQYRSLCTPAGVSDNRMITALGKLQVNGVEKKFPRAEYSPSVLNRHGKMPVDLSLIYKINYSASLNVEEAIQILLATKMLEYAEPLYIHHVTYVPNDPSLAQQYFLGKINAYTAWDVLKGDTNVVIGIVDSGTDWDHPDLQSNIKYNYADPIDGSDNDLDGFVDNFRGWDVSGNDNNPMNGNSDHGSHVSGCAAAVTDNGIGVAGPGFNCKFLPVKSSLDASTTSIDDGYDGVIYAADHGADIINCSWGRSGSFSQFEQDIVNHVTFDLDVLVIAAAGNDGVEEFHYPSSYKYVTSVAWTTSSDAKHGDSNFGFSIDVCAPGSNIYSTVLDNAYVAYSGTSMASPIAAGCAAMIKSRFPFMNALQIGEQLRITCDNIYGTSGNTAYQYKLGKGRVNLFKAITDSVSPGVIVDALTTRDQNDQVFIANDTIDITALFQNLLRTTTNLTCNLTSTSPFVSILSGTFNPGVLNSLDTITNFSAPYKVLVSPTAPTNTEVVFRITMTDGLWTDFYAFRITVNVDYINIAINDVATSITSRSLTGYNDDAQSQGLGFTYMGSNTILYEMGLMVGATGTQVSDNVRSTAGAADADFGPTVTVSGQEPGVISDFDAYGVFSDQFSPAPMNLLVTHRAFAWTTVPDRKYVMVDYSIKNNGGTSLTNLYAGLCADWDIPQYANNKASVDNSRRMGYVWSTDVGGLYGAMKLLSHTGGFSHYAIDNVSGGGGANLSDGFSNAEKFQVLSTSRADAGNTVATGNDVIDVVSSGPFNLAPGDSVIVSFAIIGGESLASIQQSAEAAQFKYDSLFVGLEPIALSDRYTLEQNFPNPANESTRLEFSIRESAKTELSIFDALGNKVKVLLDEKLEGGKYSLVFDVRELPAGIYHYSLISGDFRKTLSLTVVH